jgi:hypothetical protein
MLEKATVQLRRDHVWLCRVKDVSPRQDFFMCWNTCFPVVIVSILSLRLVVVFRKGASKNPDFSIIKSRSIMGGFLLSCR